MTIVEFLLARIAEDEAQANIDGVAAMTGYAWKGYSQDAYDELQRTTLKAAKRLHAECQAKRAIVDMHKPITLEDLWGAARTDIAKNLVCNYDSSSDSHLGDTAEWPCATLRILAAVYANHPDYDPAWRVT